MPARHPTPAIEPLESRIAPAFAATIDLSALTGTGGFKVQGGQNDLAGFSVSAAGDFNGDGFEDFLVGARNATPNGASAAGAGYVIFGKAAGFPALVDLAALDAAEGVEIRGEAVGDGLGFSVSRAGDVNGDGFDDVIVGAWRAANSGAAYVVFGRAGPGTAIEVSSLTAATGFKIQGEAAGDQAGRAVGAAGDVNGDGFDDVIVGAQLAQPAGVASGASYIVFGKAGGFASPVSLSALTGSDGFKVPGLNFADNSGCSVAGAGDVNGDGVDDIVIGAYNATGSASQSGVGYVIFGKKSAFTTPFDLTTLDGTNGFTVAGEVGSDSFGASVSSAGDINGDGFDDVVFGARAATLGGVRSGVAYVVFGKANGFTAQLAASSLNGASGFKIGGRLIGDKIGSSVAKAGDVNGDGIADLVVGAWGSDPNGTNSGAGYVLFGKTSGFTAEVSVTTLDGSNGFKLVGEATNDGAGYAVGACDVNGDGVSDIIIGAPGLYGGTASASYVILGQRTTSPDFPATIDLATLGATTGFKMPGLAAGDHLGTAVQGVGDLNGDGIADFVVSAEFAAPHGAGSGSTYVVFGKRGGLGTSIDLATLNGSNGFRIDGEAFADFSGRTAGAAGDVNGDGLDDLIIGSLNGSGGASYVVFGSRTAFTATFDLSTLSGTDGFKLIGEASGGQSSQTRAAGDVNGDGFDDVIVGDFQANAAYVVLGKASFGASISLGGLTGSDGFKVQGAGGFGRSVDGGGDVNGDGVDDVVICAFGTSPACVIFGSRNPFVATLNVSSLDGTNGFKIPAVGADGVAPQVAGAGDVNGDGIGDLILGSSASSAGASGGGGAFVVFGHRGVFGAAFDLTTLTGPNGFKVEGAIPNGHAGYAVSGAGDVNGDGLDDLLLGEPADVGIASGSYVVFGRRSGFAAKMNLSTLDGANGFKVVSENLGDFLGYSVGPAGDVNADGIADIVLGAYSAAPNGTDSGAAYVIYGRAVAPAVAPAADIDAKHPFTFIDATGDKVLVALKGSGFAKRMLTGGAANNADLATLELFNTTLTTAVSVTIISKPLGTTAVGRVFTHDALQHVGAITLGPGTTLGDGVADATPEISVTGKLNALTLGDVAANAFVQLGLGLPYDAPGNTTPDTYNNKPKVTVHDVLGPGFRLEVLGDGMPGGTGGGGLGDIVFHAWAFPGFLRTTQTIGDFTVQTGDFYGTLEVDKFHNGKATIADAGALKIEQGIWGGTGTEIEGRVKSFDAEGFIAGAIITAGSIGDATTHGGEFAGTFKLTDPIAQNLDTFIVDSDFTGVIEAAGAVKNLKIKGAFTGSLKAPAIGSITAEAFIGTATADPYGDPLRRNIIADKGALGELTAKSGTIVGYEISTPGAFGGFDITANKLLGSTIGIENVSITAAEVGSISVKLSAAKDATGVNLIGIAGSQFTSTGIGSKKSDLGGIGAVTLTLTGGNGTVNAIGIKDSVFDARVLASESGGQASTISALGKISVKISGMNGSSLGVDHSRFEGDTIGAVKVNVKPGKAPAATARAVDSVEFIAAQTIDAMTFDGTATADQVTGLTVFAGGAVKSLAIKSTTSAFGSLVDSSVVAGQALSLAGSEKQQRSALRAAALGAVNVSGSMIRSQLVAGAAIAAVTVGGSVNDSLLLAGANLGDDYLLDGDETFQRAASIASVTIKGTLARSSIIAGIDPVDRKFGDDGDKLAAQAGSLTDSSSIGAVKIGGSFTALSSSLPHHFGIEAASIKALKLGDVSVTDLAAPLFLNSGAATEDADKIRVRVITS